MHRLFLREGHAELGDLAAPAPDMAESWSFCTPTFRNNLENTSLPLHSMLNCRHCHWVDISQGDVEIAISYGMRLEHTIVYFIGKRAKASALQNKITRRPAQAIGNLHADSNTYTSRYPTVFADCTPVAKCVN